METTIEYTQQKREKSKRGHKSTIACNFCRLKKIKCNGGFPCPNCLDHHIQCDYSPAARRRNHSNSKDLKTLCDRLARVEALLPGSDSPAVLGSQTDDRVNTKKPSPMGENGLFSVSLENPISQEESSSQTPALTNSQAVRSPVPEFSHVSSQFSNSQVEPIRTPVEGSGFTTKSDPPGQSQPHPQILETNISEMLHSQVSPAKTVATSLGEDDGSSTLPPEEDLSFEYHGPGSFLSICSKSGIEWVVDKTGVAEFGQMANRLTLDVFRRLKLDASVPSKREPEPEEAIAWQYTGAYFDDDPDAGYGIISRVVFENLLRAHFSKDANSNLGSDPAWYALRNVVYAAGCRAILVVLSTELSTKNFMQSRSWYYFLNALSVHTELLYSRTSLMAVQALTAMSFYVEGIGCPSIDYMLCSNAMMLAQSKGLHRQPSAAWNLGNQAIQSRSYLWWAIYGYERQNAGRSGRPLAVDDNDITCQIPTEIPTRSRVNLDIMASAIAHARLSGEINRKVAALKVSKPCFKELTETITALSDKLQNWWFSLPAYIREDLGSRHQTSRPLPLNVRFTQVIYHHYAYYGSLVAIHSILVHPWNTMMFRIEPSQRQEYMRLVTSCTEVYVRATRHFIKNLPHLNINVSTPKWLVFVFPLVTIINLFIYVIQNPLDLEAESDIGLMYLVAGHFSYLEFATSDLTFPFVRQLANLARLTVNKARQRNSNPSSFGTFPEASALAHGGDEIELGGLENEMLNDMNLDSEKWATLVGLPDLDTMSMMDMIEGYSC